MSIKAQKGTKDILPSEVGSWQKIEEIAKDLFTKANFQEIRTPIFEATELFERGVGDTTDIVNKEMYSFEKSNRSITLRPENTAGVVRAYLEHNMQRESAPVKLWYSGPMFRYERPQAGRQRQFHQIGIEMFGIKDSSADAECINIATKFLNNLGLNDLIVEINSLGCNACRVEYRERLKANLSPYVAELCEDCISRYEKNPLRILDCKNEACVNVLAKNNLQSEVCKINLCDECSTHYEELKKHLDALNINYIENSFLVRGLDYYTKTVFEIKSNNLGSQNAVCGGGRYDGLVETLEGPATPAVGWAMGVERLNSLVNFPQKEKIDYFIVSSEITEALKLAQEIRDKGYIADLDYSKRKFAKQLEKASKLSKMAIILGSDEVNTGMLTIKDLSSFEQKQVSRLEFLKGL